MPKLTWLWVGLVAMIFVTAIAPALFGRSDHDKVHELEAYAKLFAQPTPSQHTQPLEHQCASGDLEACTRMIADAREQTRFAVDLELLRQALVRACLGVAGPWCLEAAWFQHYQFVDRDAPVDTRIDAAVLLARACEAGVARACELGDAPSLYTACFFDDEALACYAHGMYGYDRHSDTLSVESLSALDRACEGEIAEACYAAGVARQRGLAQPSDLEGAERDFHRACALEGKSQCTAAQEVAKLRALSPERRPPPDPNDLQFPRRNPPAKAQRWHP